jgi:hypothetical protein
MQTESPVFSLMRGKPNADIAGYAGSILDSGAAQAVLSLAKSLNPPNRHL